MGRAKSASCSRLSIDLEIFGQNTRINMKIGTTILIAVSFLVHFIPSECAPIDETEIEKLEDAVSKAVRESNFSKAKEIQQKIDKIVMDKTATNQNSLQGGQKYAKIPKWLKEAMKTSSRIVGGNNAPAPIPWQVHVHYKGSGFLCGGTILDEETILSAAHCFYPLLDRSDPADYIAAGIKREGSSAGQKVDIKEVIIHPEYDYSRAVAKFDNDIAILKLKEPLTFNADVQPARLPDSTLNPEDKETFAIVSGWGRVRYGGPSSKDLKYVFVPILGVDKCVNLNSLYTPSNITSNMICAGDLTDGGVDACQGDSGGPLVIPFSDSDDTVIEYGVVSWGFRCAELKGPGMYARVSNYNSWIQGYLTKPKTTRPKTTTKKPDSSSDYSYEDYSSPDYSSLNNSSQNNSSLDYTYPDYSSPNNSSSDNSSLDYSYPDYSYPDYSSLNQNTSIGCLIPNKKYEGSANQTISGDACLPWSTPGLPRLFKDQDKWNHNYCRNSGDFDDIPICYVDKSTYDDCEIPSCDLPRVKKT